MNNPLLNIAIQATRNAAKIITRAMDRLDTLSIDEKSRNDYVTQIDRLSEQEIIYTIQKAYPSHSILAEESGVTAASSEYRWIIDPLDGTLNYIHGFPHFAISIGLQYRGELEIAVVYDPILQELFTAKRGGGAQMNDRRIRVSPCKKLNKALIGTGFPCTHPELFNPYLKTFENILPEVSEIRRAGSAALDLAYVACGRLDGYWEMGLSPWDIAGGILLVTESGGFVGDFSGNSGYLENGHCVAGNSKIYNALLEKIKQ